MNNCIDIAEVVSFNFNSEETVDFATKTNEYLYKGWTLLDVKVIQTVWDGSEYGEILVILGRPCEDLNHEETKS